MTNFIPLLFAAHLLVVLPVALAPLLFVAGGVVGLVHLAEGELPSLTLNQHLQQQVPHLVRLIKTNL